MIKLLWRTDVHARDGAPASRTDVWMDTVADKLAQVGELAREHRCHGVLDGGDFFHHKPPVRTSHRLVARVARIHQTYPCPVWANVGNHDVELAQLDNLIKNPLETLFATGVFRRMYDEHEAVFIDGEIKVRVVGIPYHGPRYDLDRFRALRRGDEDWLVCCAHVLASPEGGEMFGGEDVIRYSELAELAPDVDVFAFGHWHKNQGIQAIAADKWVINVGSLTRGSLTQDNLDREPGVALMQFPARNQGPPVIEFVKLRIQPASEVFDLEKRVREETRAATVDGFVEAIRRDLENRSGKPFLELLGEMELPDKIRERALSFIERAQR